MADLHIGPSLPPPQSNGPIDKGKFFQNGPRDPKGIEIDPTMLKTGPSSDMTIYREEGVSATASESAIISADPLAAVLTSSVQSMAGPSGVRAFYGKVVAHAPQLISFPPLENAAASSLIAQSSNPFFAPSFMSMMVVSMTKLAKVMSMIKVEEGKWEVTEMKLRIELGQEIANNCLRIGKLKAEMYKRLATAAAIGMAFGIAAGATTIAGGTFSTTRGAKMSATQTGATKARGINSVFDGAASSTNAIGQGIKGIYENQVQGKYQSLISRQEAIRAILDTSAEMVRKGMDQASEAFKEATSMIDQLYQNLKSWADSIANSIFSR